MELTQPFVRLPYSFDPTQLQRELDQFESGDWMEHPNKMEGNLAIPLISLNGQNNNDFSGRMLPTAHLQRCEYMQQSMASFNEVLARSRLMRLNAGCQVAPHVDFNYHWYSRVRIHIPIVTNPDVIFHCGDQKIHMQAGECWIFDSWRRHKVVNSSDQDRVHLVIDTAGSSRFWNTVREMQGFGIDTNNAELTAKLRQRPYAPGVASEIKTEQFNNAPIMAPGELEAIADELIADLKANAENDINILAEYQYLLSNLAKDWRELWHLYGYQQSGWPHYKELLDKTAGKLRPNPRVLVTASNDVGANPIVMQRILRAALNVDQMAAFQER